MKEKKPFLCFIHIERSGGTTLHHMLRENFPLSYYNISPRSGELSKYGLEIKKHHFKRLIKNVANINGMGGHNLRAYNNYKDVCSRPIHYITFLRDPVKRCLSHYNFHIIRKGIKWSIDEYMERKEYQNFQTTKIAGIPDFERAKEIITNKFYFIGLTEEYDKSMAIFNKKYNLQENYKKKNALTNNGLLKYEDLNNSQKEKITSINNLDYQLYDFVKNNIFIPQENNEIYNLKSNAFFNRIKKPINKYYRGIFRYLIEPYLLR